MPKITDPVEINFAKKFTEKGGKFLFVENKNAALKTLDKILLENSWDRKQVVCLNKILAQGFNLNFSSVIPKETKVLFETILVGGLFIGVLIFIFLRQFHG